MAARVAATEYGPPALETLRRVVADAKDGDPMATVTVLLPNNLAGIVARRHLARGLGDGGAGGPQPGVAALHLTTLPRLAERFAAAALTPRRPATRPLVAGAWRRALDADPGSFGEVATHPATVRALVQAHRELRDVSAAAIDAIRDSTTITSSLVDLHARATATIHEGHYDVRDLLDRAAELVAQEPGRIQELGTLVLYLPQDLSQAETEFANALAEAAALTVVAAFTGVRRADAAVRTTLRRLGLDSQGADTPDRPIIPAASHILTASDSDDEVRCVVREVVATLEHTPAHRVAVLYAAASPYARLLLEHLNQAGIAVNGAGTRPINERATVRTLLEVLALAAEDAPRAALFRALAGAPTRDFAGNRIPVSRWERTSRSAGVVSGDDWAVRLDAYIAGQRATISLEETSDDPQMWRIDRAQAAMQTAQDLHAFAERLRGELAVAQRMTTWRDLADWCHELFATLVGAGPDLLRLPPEEQYAAASVTSALNAVGGLDAVDTLASYQALVEVLDLELSSALPRVGRFGDGVLVAPISHAIGLDVDVVYVVGLAEDIYPGRLHEDALLPERVRDAAAGELPSYRERLHTRHRNLLAAFAAGSRRAVASFPRGDLRRSSRRLPSRWLLPSLRELTGDHQLAASDWEAAAYPAGTISNSGSFAGELLTTKRLSHEQEWRVRQARSARDLDDDVVRAGVEMIRARASARFTRYDGNLVGADGLPDYAGGDRVVSPTALESYAECPHAFFVGRLLGVEPIEQPEDIVEISPAEIGNLVHASLDTLVSEAGEDLPGFGEPWTPSLRARLVEIALALADEFELRGVTGHPRLWAEQRDRILIDLAWLLDNDNGWRAGVRARVAASELTFGMRGQEPVEVLLPGGSMLMRGSADKVDLGEDGTIYVTDVKTGSRRTFKEIKQEEPFVDGTKLQLPVYAYAARQRFGDRATPVHATYWFVRPHRTDAGNRGRIGIDLTLDVEQQYAATLGTLVSSIRTGLFPLRAPKDPDFAWVQCWYCNPDGIGHGDNRERWERKRLDPVLREYLTLVEPDVVAAADSDDDDAGSGGSS